RPTGKPFGSGSSSSSERAARRPMDLITVERREEKALFASPWDDPRVYVNPAFEPLMPEILPHIERVVAYLDDPRSTDRDYEASYRPFLDYCYEHGIDSKNVEAHARKFLAKRKEARGNGS